MVNFKNLIAHTSPVIYLSGVPSINVHVSDITHPADAPRCLDIRFEDARISTSSYINGLRGFNRIEAFQVFHEIVAQREFFYELAKKQGECSVKTEKELYEL